LLDQFEAIQEGLLCDLRIALAEGDGSQAFEDLFSIGMVDGRCALEELTALRHVPALPPEAPEDSCELRSVAWISRQAMLDQLREFVVSALKPVQPLLNFLVTEEVVRAR